MRKPMNIACTLPMHMSSAQMFQMLLMKACSSEKPRDIMRYLLVNWLQSHQHSSMTTLANYILKEYPDIKMNKVVRAAVIFNGCPIRHQLPSRLDVR